MPTDDETLTDEEKQAAEATKTAALPDLTDEQFEAVLQKRMGVGSADLIKKSEQVTVLTDDEKAELEEKKNSAILEFALANKHTTKKDYDEYIAASKADKVEVARTKFIRLNPDMDPKEAAEAFNTLFKVEEEDEIDGAGETLVPNKAKKTARLLAEKIAEEEINTRYAPIIGLSAKYDQHLAIEKVKKANDTLISKTIKDLPRTMELEVEGEKYSIAIEENDFEEAMAMVKKDALSQADLKPEQVKANAALFLKSKNLDRIIREIRDTAVDNALDKAGRGKNGLIPDKKDSPAVTNEKMEFLKKHGITV